MSNRILLQFSGLLGQPRPAYKTIAGTRPEADYPPKLKAQMLDDCGIKLAADAQRLGEALYYARQEAFSSLLPAHLAWTDLPVDNRRMFVTLAELLLAILHPDTEHPGSFPPVELHGAELWWAARCIGSRLDVGVRPSRDIDQVTR